MRVTRPVPVGDPVEPILSLAEAQRIARVQPGVDDIVLEDLIVSAAVHVSGWDGALGRCLVAQEWSFGASGLPAELPLPMPDASAPAVAYIDAEGQAQVVPEVDLEVREGIAGAVLAYTGPSLPLASRAAPVTITATYGWPDAASVPAHFRQIVRALVVHWYDHRGAVMAGENQREIPMSAQHLISTHRWRGV